MSEARIVCDGYGGCGALIKQDRMPLHVEWHRHLAELELRLRAVEVALNAQMSAQSRRQP